jgi:hypothetical protein
VNLRINQSQNATYITFLKVNINIVVHCAVQQVASTEGVHCFVHYTVDGGNMLVGNVKTHLRDTSHKLKDYILYLHHRTSLKSCTAVLRLFWTVWSWRWRPIASLERSETSETSCQSTQRNIPQHNSDTSVRTSKVRSSQCCVWCSESVHFVEVLGKTSYSYLCNQ